MVTEMKEILLNHIQVRYSGRMVCECEAETAMFYGHYAKVIGKMLGWRVGDLKQKGDE